MKKLILIFCVIPILSFANGFYPFKTATQSGNKISLTFQEAGVKYNVSYKNQSFISSYGQVLNLNQGDQITLTERHTKFIVTADIKCSLKIKSIHNWQGKITEKNYSVNICKS